MCILGKEGDISPDKIYNAQSNGINLINLPNLLKIGKIKIIKLLFATH